MGSLRGAAVVFPLIMPFCHAETLCKHPRHVDPKHVVCEQKSVSARFAGESVLLCKLLIAGIEVAPGAQCPIAVSYTHLTLPTTPYV